jgi:hypothetical protein
MPLTATAYREFLGRAAGPLAGMADFPAAAFHALAAVGVAAASPSASADADFGDDVDKVASRLRLRVERLYSRIQRTYNVGLPSLTAGVLDLGGVQRNDPGMIDY